MRIVWCFRGTIRVAFLSKLDEPIPVREAGKVGLYHNVDHEAVPA